MEETPLVIEYMGDANGIPQLVEPQNVIYSTYISDYDDIINI